MSFNSHDYFSLGCDYCSSGESSRVFRGNLDEFMFFNQVLTLDQINGIKNQGIKAAFNEPQGLAVDTLGNVYVADTNNHKIRKIDPSGHVTTFAGSGYSGSSDGQGSTATFNKPTGLAIDSTGTIYVSEFGGNKIRKIDSSGNVSTLAGSGITGSTDGQGSAATFNKPTGLAIDSTGNIYVSEFEGNKIRLIDSSGNVNTLAGKGVEGSSDGIGTSSSFKNPSGVVLDSVGNIYVTDSGNNKIRKIVIPGRDERLDLNPVAVFMDGQGNELAKIPVSIRDNDTTGKRWSALFLIDNQSIPGLSEMEEDLAFKIIHSDYAGNQKTSASWLTLKPVDNAGNQLTAHIDTKGPKLTSIQATTTKAIDEYRTDNSSIHLLKVGDTVTISFTLDESVAPSISLLIGSDNRSVQLNSLDNNQGKSWEAVYVVQQGDSGMAKWSIDGGDHAGNPITKDSSVQSISSMSFDQVGGYAFDTDTTPPGLSALSWAFNSSGIRDRDHDDKVLLKRGDNITLSFTSSDPLTTAVGFEPQLIVKDDSGTQLGSGIFSKQASDTNETLWQAIYTVPDNASVLADMEKDIGFELKVSDRSGNQITLSYDHNGKPSDSSQPEQFPTFRIDTQMPQISLATLSSTLSSVQDPLRPNHLFADIGDNISLDLTTSERIIHSPLNAEVSTLTTGSISDAQGISYSGNHLYVADKTLNKILRIDKSTGSVTTAAGKGGSSVYSMTNLMIDGIGANAGFGGPNGITRFGSYLFITEASAEPYDLENKRSIIRVMDPSNDNVSHKYIFEGSSSYKVFSEIRGVATDGSHLFILDGNKIHKASLSTGQMEGSNSDQYILAGGSNGSQDGTGSAAKFNNPTDIIFVGSDLFIADQDNHKIRKLVIATGEVTTLAGTGAAGSTDGPGAQAMFNKPSGMTTDRVHLYVADQDNHKIRKVNIVTGEVSTLTGSGSAGSLDGAADNATLRVRRK